MEIKLEPTLASCIETVTKKEYERVLGALLKMDHEDENLAEELELLRTFLESADFGDLRSRTDELLLQGKKVECILKTTDSPQGYGIEIITS